MSGRARQTAKRSRGLRRRVERSFCGSGRRTRLRAKCLSEPERCWHDHVDVLGSGAPVHDRRSEGDLAGVHGRAEVDVAILQDSFAKAAVEFVELVVGLVAGVVAKANDVKRNVR